MIKVGNDEGDRGDAGEGVMGNASDEENAVDRVWPHRLRGACMRRGGRAGTTIKSGRDNGTARASSGGNVF